MNGRGMYSKGEKQTRLALFLRIGHLIENKRVPTSQLEKLLKGGYLSDLLDANVDQIDRDKARKLYGLKAMGIEPLEIPRKKSI